MHPFTVNKLELELIFINALHKWHQQLICISKDI